MGIEPTYPAWKAGVLPLNYTCVKKCPKQESNRRHEDFQSSALPTELSGHIVEIFRNPTTKIFYNTIFRMSSIFLNFMKRYDGGRYSRCWRNSWRKYRPILRGLNLYGSGCAVRAYFSDPPRISRKCWFRLLPSRYSDQRSGCARCCPWLCTDR